MRHCSMYMLSAYAEHAWLRATQTPQKYNKIIKHFLFLKKGEETLKNHEFRATLKAVVDSYPDFWSLGMSVSNMFYKS